MKALLTNYHQSPRKVGLVAGVIRGKSVSAARAALAFLPQKSAPDIAKLLNSAVANARQSGQSEENLFVKTITVNKGMVMRRFKPMARGRAARYAKTMSHIALELGTRAASQKEAAKKEKVAAKKTSAKKTTKKADKKSE